MLPKIEQTPRLPWLLTDDWVSTRSKAAGSVWSNLASVGRVGSGSTIESAESSPKRSSSTAVGGSSVSALAPRLLGRAALGHPHAHVGELGDEAADVVVQVEHAALDQDHDGDARDALGHREDAEDAVVLQRCS